MMTCSYHFDAVDSLFFRDGRPFNAGETGQMEVEGVFPPGARTIVGAMRASFARQLGWDGSSDWDESIIKQLGDFKELDPLAFGGPYLVKCDQLLLPAPLHILAKEYRDELIPVTCFNRDGLCFDAFSYLLPQTKEQALLCDLSLQTDTNPIAVRLPQKTTATQGAKPLTACWLSVEDMKKALSGNAEELSQINPVVQDELWQTEERVGIRRHKDSRTTKDDGLYQIQHIRPCETLGLAMTLQSQHHLPKLEPLLTLGGESRMVWAKRLGIDLPEAAELKVENGTVCYTVTLITPAKFSNQNWKQVGKQLENLPGSIVSACTAKSVMLGGWDSRKGHNKPLELQPFVPAGSTWFIKAEKGDAEEIKTFNQMKIGQDTAWGYGQILIGSWEER